MKMFEHLFHSTFQLSRSGAQCLWAIVCAAALLAGSVAAQEPAKEPAKREMTDEEKVASWKGEKVILIGSAPGDTEKTLQQIPFRPCPEARGGNCPCFHRFGKPEETLPSERYVGKTGVITEASLGQGYGSRLPLAVVQFHDSGEKILACTETRFGFFSEKEVASKLVGRSLWARGGRHTLESAAELSKPISQRARISLKNTQRVTVTRIEWGFPLQTVTMCMKTVGGDEGCTEDHLRYYFESRFHVDTSTYPYTHIFYLEDPHKLYPAWSKVVWEVIENGEVGIGMTEEMVKMACVDDLEKTGFVLTPPDVISPIYRCHGKQFLVDKGKVTKYVEGR